MTLEYHQMMTRFFPFARRGPNGHDQVQQLESSNSPSGQTIRMCFIADSSPFVNAWGAIL
jgi:hypothetical protein